MKYLSSLILVSLILCSCGAAGNAAGDSGYQSEIVNVGYGESSRDNLSYSVSKVDVDDRDIAGYNNILDYLRGRVPGLYIGNSNGVNMPEIYIRGINSVNSSCQPLLIVDGCEVSSIMDLNPNDIHNVTVLKDASASIYGVRGANGVIQIETKGARAIKMQESVAAKAARKEAAARKKAEREARKAAKAAEKIK